MKARYVSFFSYIGTNFRSSEKIWLKEGSCLPDPRSVQGLIELALLKLRSVNYPRVCLSSRTDGGVHALETSAHFDLERRGSGIYNPESITYMLNRTFFRNDTSIHIHRCLRVNDDFSARRKALSRTYLYRFAVVKKDINDTLPQQCHILSYVPIEEWKRCHYLRLKNFNIARFIEGTKYFIGYHDFTTFKKYDQKLSHKHNRREILSIDVRLGQPLVTSYRTQPDGVFDYWEVEIKGRGFVHNQIRRMIGTLISVATGKLPPEEIRVMLQVPSRHSWVPFASSVPANGLYLCNVEYNPADLVYRESDVQTSEVISDSLSEDEEIELD